MKNHKQVIADTQKTIKELDKLLEEHDILTKSINDKRSGENGEKLDQLL